jgi:putative oxidoreductase
MSNSRPVVLWIAIALGVLAYAGAGTSKVLGVDRMVQSFTNYGLPLWFMTFIGLCEVAGAVGLLLRGLSAWAAIGLSIIMIGAIVVHLRYDSPVLALPATVLLLLMIYVARQRWSDALFVAPSAAAKSG